MKTIGAFFLTISLLVSLLFLVCVYRALFIFSQPPKLVECSKDPSHVAISEKTRPGVVDRFRQAIRFKTITTGTRTYDAEQLEQLIAFLTSSYPKVHSSSFVQRQRVANYSLLYTITGTNPSLEPYLLCSHLDVVPVEKDKWIVEPFDGVIKDGYIYGRGTLDVKDTLMAIFESLEHLLETGFKPERSFFLAFGHDEEASGFEGAKAMAELLHEKLKGSKLLYLLDEGTIIVKPGSFPGVLSPVAMIGVSEKGYATFKMIIKGNAGHSSMPPRETSIVTLGKALSKFTVDAHPSRFSLGPEKGLFESLALEASFPFKLVYGNLWLFKHVLSWFLTQNAMSVGLTRTTTAVTMISGGVKENVIPSQVKAVINHRIHPMDTVDSVLQLDRSLVADFEDVSVDLNEGWAFEPHPISPYDATSFGYNVIAQSIRKVFPNSVPVPGTMLASTDTKWYLNLTHSIYRFTPALLESKEAILFHGHNERISVENYIAVVNFYHHLMIDSNLPKLHSTSHKKDEL